MTLYGTGWNGLNEQQTNLTEKSERSYINQIG